MLAGLPCTEPGRLRLIVEFICLVREANLLAAMMIFSGILTTRRHLLELIYIATPLCWYSCTVAGVGRRSHRQIHVPCCKLFCAVFLTLRAR